MTPIKRPLGDIKDPTILEHIKNLQEQYQGNTLILSSAPTAGAPLLEDKELGQFGNDLFIRVGQTIYKISSDDQITIT